MQICESRLGLGELSLRVYLRACTARVTTEVHRDRCDHADDQHDQAATMTTDSELSMYDKALEDTSRCESQDDTIQPHGAEPTVAGIALFTGGPLHGHRLERLGANIELEYLREALGRIATCTAQARCESAELGPTQDVYGAGTGRGVGGKWAQC